MFDFLFKKKYGVALGAGAAKGIVHIGVIKALEEMNIEITHIGGSSIGSLIGGMYALWGDINKVEEIILNYDNKQLNKLFRGDIGLSKGVFKGDIVLNEIQKYIGNAKINECKIPYIAVSLDILTGERVYHTDGLLKDAIRASCSIPLIFKPYELNGRYLVDGALAECVPVQATESIGAKKILAVNVEGFPRSTDKINLKTLSVRTYQAAVYHLAQKDIALANKKLNFELSKYSMEELIGNAKEYIQLGYNETLKLFK
jgi:NTE family protein